MKFSPFNRALLRRVLAGAVVFAAACSPPDRAESGSDTTAATLPDTGGYAPQPSSSDTAMGVKSDTSRAPESSSTKPATPAPSAGQVAPSNRPRAETAPPSDSNGAGYRPMERDTGSVPDQDLDSARVTADTSEATQAPSDSSVSGIPATADTAAIDVQADTAASAGVSVALADSTEAITVDTADNASRIRSPEDSTQVSGGVRVSPPEDSTEILADETADEQIVNPDDQETVAASKAATDEVGAAAVTSDVTGAEAVVLMTREGVRCTMVDLEENEAVRWDMSSTPVTLNPCGMGSMNLSRIWTKGQRGGGAAGQ